MDRILFGDNQFFGVNHASEEKARLQTIRFKNIESIIKVLDTAYDAGIRTFMCTTHDRIAEVCEHVRSNPARYASFKFYPCMPYAHKYANAVTEHGMLDALRLFLPEQGAVAALFRGGRSLAFKDMEGIAQLLIDAEMKMFSRLSTPVVFLQNIVTDLLLGLGAKDAFRFFADHVVRRYNAEPGFITMNLPRLLDTLEDVGIVDPIVCANINSAGLSHVWRHSTLRGNNRDAEVSPYSDVGARIGRTRAAGGHRLCVPTEEYSLDRIRRIDQGTYRGDQAPDRRVERRPFTVCAGGRGGPGCAGTTSVVR